MTLVEKDEILRIVKIETAPYGTNAYIVVCETTGESVLIDAPGNADKILDKLEGTNPICILITHRHMDHTGVLQGLKDELNVPVAVHMDDADSLPIKGDMLL